MELMENGISRVSHTIPSDASDRNGNSEPPALDRFGAVVPPASPEFETPPPPSPVLHELDLDYTLPEASPNAFHSLHSLNESAVVEHSYQSGIIDVSTSPTDSKAPFVRGHRRRSTHVTRRDLEKFRKEVLGIVEERPLWCEEGGDSSTTSNPSVLEKLNSAFTSATMSLNSGNGGPGSGMFPNYIDNGANSANMGNAPRQSMSPAMPGPPQVNGGGMPGMNAGIPINAGHQMDLHHLYEMVLELSDVLKNNRETTKSIVSSAEEIMKRTSSEGTTPSLQQVNGELSAARIAELERALAKEKRLVEILKQEQTENTRLIGEYEAAVGTMVEQIRNYCQNNNMHYLAQKRHYNNLLQSERDAHLESRLDRDYWHAQTMKCAEMIRTAYRLRSEEDELPIRIVAGLQNEVRAYRNALGMDPEKPEEEYGWEILKDVPPNSD
ncbi:uncharacterized protein ACLA_022600 [Aspergillus clavatus NRRL 1]|uniref:Uncharacterized protein n=1 Tax=Aspergillus clavatus (strain ATCC 1007 / CBS 513.65 / DSM 816 / NCTC 3887 / NRRL 1 / QM 1276 / 107) TaxID=344612 RepID=A1CPH5_ASPCL|nr:uncharacterized protein ACLA_022600 [Aspergillus clavatus NRRL 1]EAW07546.1 conserved hypothetical protein [Aspergillus clavatus NRRL 1]